MAMHTTVHLNPSDVIAITTALGIYKEQLIREKLDGWEQDVQHVNALIAKINK